MIETGDKVKVVMANNSLFDSCECEMKLLSRPQGPGDCFIFENSDGSQLILNGNSSDFVGIVEIAQ